MGSVDLAEIRQQWRLFLIDLMFASRYELGYIDAIHLPPKNPVLERLLPSLLHIKAVAILDCGLRRWCAAMGSSFQRSRTEQT
jgi:hypothetical protein